MRVLALMLIVLLGFVAFVPCQCNCQCVDAWTATQRGFAYHQQHAHLKDTVWQKYFQFGYSDESNIQQPFPSELKPTVDKY